MIRIAVLITVIASQAWSDTLTTTRVLRAQSIIAPEDLTVMPGNIPGTLDGAAKIVGLEAKTTLYPGHPIKPGSVGPAALVERNQPVTLVYKNGGLTISAEARALSRGAVGDTVKAMNLSSRTTVFGRVEADGTVAVSF